MKLVLSILLIASVAFVWCESDSELESEPEPSSIESLVRSAEEPPQNEAGDISVL